MGHLAVKGLAPLLVLVLSAVALSLRAQGETSQASVKAECAVLDASLPPIRLGYSISSDYFNNRGQVGLTLYNNTTCSLHVESNGESDPDKLRILYDVQDRRRSLVPSHKGYWTESDVRFFKELLPGKSLDVRVEKAHARARLTVSVRFLFSWEISGPSSDFEHRVYFDSSNWPRR